MAKAIDLTGQDFGYLHVIERDYQAQEEHKNERQAWWKCQCNACGKIKSFRGSIIRKAKSCGCIQERKGVLSEKQQAQIAKLAEKNSLDLTGQRFSRLVVLSYAPEDKQIYYGKQHKRTWLCQCDCGNQCYVTTENLRRGNTPSCGCITKENRAKQLKDLTGQKFGHLEVLKYLGTINGNSKYWVRCDCGKEYELYGNNLTQGYTTSCGCVKESHGEVKIRELLIKNNINFINEKTFNDFNYEDTKGKPRYDFFLPEYNILIEYDGEQHFRPVYSWDTKERYNQRVLHDDMKNQYAIDHGFTLIRIPYTHYNDLCLEDLLLNSKYIIRKDENIC